MNEINVIMEKQRFEEQNQQIWDFFGFRLVKSGVVPDGEMWAIQDRKVICKVTGLEHAKDKCK